MRIHRTPPRFAGRGLVRAHSPAHGRLLALLAVAAVACGEGPPPADRSFDSRWHELHRDALIRRERVRAVVANHLGHWSAVRKYQNLFRMFRVDERIPVGPHLDELVRTIEETTRTVGFREVAVETRIEGAGPPDLPETVETPGGHAWKPEEVAGTVWVVIRARPADLGLAERLVSAIRDDLPRLVVFRAVRLGRGAVRIEGEAFHFHDVRPPVQVLRPPDLARDVAAAGLPSDPSDPETAFLLLDLTRLYGEIAVDVALSGPSLFQAARARLMAERFDFFKRRAAEAEAVRFSDLLAH